MSFADWQTAVQPKVDGTWNLHHASCGLELDFFLLFSSWSGLVGQWGQANYAAVSVFSGVIYLSAVWLKSLLGKFFP